jgi:hypothetical protein
MSKAQSVKFLFVLWLVLFGGSLAFRFAGAGAEPLDIALGRGLSLVFGQVLAAGAAVMCWSAAKTLPQGTPLRWVGHVPVAVTLLVFAYVAWTVTQAFRQGAA